MLSPTLGFINICLCLNHAIKIQTTHKTYHNAVVDLVVRLSQQTRYSNLQ
jgi:hypothetical protein